jgi:hypothetical protein
VQAAHLFVPTGTELATWPLVAELITPDGRYIVVKGRLWRAANPALTNERREELVASLMKARRAVASAKRADDRGAERTARRDVHKAKLALGERGPVWWSDGAPGLNRRLARNTPYAAWYDQAMRWEAEILALLDERADGSSICPSEVARAISPEGWRAAMEDVRQAARRLAMRGEVEILQRGTVLDPSAEFHGPIRIARRGQS